jgi:hypothetical protein
MFCLRNISVDTLHKGDSSDDDDDNDDDDDDNDDDDDYDKPLTTSDTQVLFLQ